MNERKDGTEEQGGWPYKSLLFLGYFGMGEPEGKRLFWQVHLAVAVMLISVLMLHFAEATPVPRLVWLATLALAALGIIWAYVHYLRQLDELRLLIQLKALAVAYACAMVYWVLVLSLSVIFGQAMFILVLLWIVPAEISRGIALTCFARRYG
jgi:hypothetical protein